MFVKVFVNSNHIYDMQFCRYDYVYIIDYEIYKTVIDTYINDYLDLPSSVKNFLELVNISREVLSKLSIGEKIQVKSYGSKYKKHYITIPSKYLGKEIVILDENEYLKLVEKLIKTITGRTIKKYEEYKEKTRLKL